MAHENQFMQGGSNIVLRTYPLIQELLKYRATRSKGNTPLHGHSNRAAHPPIHSGLQDTFPNLTQPYSGISKFTFVDCKMKMHHSIQAAFNRLHSSFGF